MVVLGRLQVQRWQCQVCLGRVSPLPPGVTAFQRPQAFRELVTSLYVYSVSLRGLVRILDLLGCGVGAATLWRDVQAVAPGRMPDPQAALSPWLEVDETWLSIGGAQRPVAVVLGPTGERLDLRLSGPGFDGDDGFTDLAQRGARILTTDDAPVYGPALDASGLDRQQCAVHMQRTVGHHIRDLDEDALIHLDRALLPILQRLARGRVFGSLEAGLAGNLPGPAARHPLARHLRACLRPVDTLRTQTATPLLTFWTGACP